MELKPLSREGVPHALEKAVRYRLLNEPADAESICHDVLAVDPENQEALTTLLLALTDQIEQRSDAEVERYGHTSFELGAELLAANGLPDSISEAVRGEVTSDLANLTSYVRLASAAVFAVGDVDYDAIEQGGIGDRLESIARDTDLEIDRLQLVLLTLDAAGVADQVWTEKVA